MEKNYCYYVDVYTQYSWFTGHFEQLMDALSFYNDFFKKCSSDLKSISIYFVDDDGEKIPLEIVDMYDSEEDLPF